MRRFNLDSVVVGLGMGIGLAQHRPLTLEKNDQVLTALFWLAVAGVVLGLSFWALRRWLGRGAQKQIDSGFSLDQLRQMHRSGELSDAQYESAKAVIIGRGLGEAPSSTDEPELGPNLLDETESDQSKDDQTDTDSG